MRISKAAARPCLSDSALIWIILLGSLVFYCAVKDEEYLRQWSSSVDKSNNNNKNIWYRPSTQSSSSSNDKTFDDLELGPLVGHGFVSWGFQARLQNDETIVMAKVTTDKFLYYSDIEIEIFDMLNAPPTIPNIPQLQMRIRSIPNPFTNQTYLQQDLGVEEKDVEKLLDARRISVQVMELLGESHKPTTLTEFRVYLKSLLETLAFVHSRGIIHCDLHSNNIHFDGTQVTLFDWNGAFVFEPNRVKIHRKYAPKHLFPPEAQTNTSAVHATVSAFDIYTVGLLIKKAIEKNWSDENDKDFSLKNKDEVLDRLVDLAKFALKEDPHKRPDAKKLLRHKFFSTPMIETGKK